MNRCPIATFCSTLFVAYTLPASVAKALPLSAAVLAAPAQARLVQLRWLAPVGCPSHDEVEHEIQRLLATSSDHQDIDVRMVVRRADDGIYSLDVDLRAPVGGTRSLEHDDCGAVIRAAALVVALAIDADAVAVVEEQTTTQDAPPSIATSDEQAKSRDQLEPQKPVVAQRPEPQNVERDAVNVNHSTQASADSPFLVHLALGAHVEGTFAPSAAWGPLVAAGFSNRWFLAEMSFGGMPGYVVNVPNTDVGARFEALWLEGDVCAGMLRRVVNVALCIAGREYWIRATGRGVDEVLKPTTAVFAAAGGPMLALELGAWRLLGVFQGVVPFARPEFVVDNLRGSVFRPPKIGLSGRVALSLTL